MNQVVSALERRGLVIRRPDDRHARTRRASVTADGLDVLERCERSVDAVEADMLGDLPAEAVELMSTSLATCARALELTLARRTPRPRAVVDGTPDD